MALFMSKRTACKSLQTDCKIDIIKQILDEQPAERLTAQAAAAVQKLYSWASSFPGEQGFSHLLFPPLVSKWPTTLDTELSLYWQSLLYRLSLDGHHNDFNSTELWQPMPSLSPQNLIPVQSPLLFHFISCRFWQLLVTFPSYRDGNIVVLHL